MTALALEAQSFLTNLLNSVSGILNSFYATIITARQAQANFIVAQMLQREYPNESFDYIYQMVCAGKIEEIGND
jgi:hypothetical protein